MMLLVRVYKKLLKRPELVMKRNNKTLQSLRSRPPQFVLLVSPPPKSKFKSKNRFKRS
jgi:hypothetical protein